MANLASGLLDLSKQEFIRLTTKTGGYLAEMDALPFRQVNCRTKSFLPRGRGLQKRCSVKGERNPVW